MSLFVAVERQRNEKDQFICKNTLNAANEIRDTANMEGRWHFPPKCSDTWKCLKTQMFIYTCSEGMLALTNDVTRTDRHSQTSELSLLFALLLWLLSNGRRRPFGFLHLLCGFAITGLRLFLQCTHRKQWSPCHFTSPLSQWANTISAGYSWFFFFLP